MKVNRKSVIRLILQLGSLGVLIWLIYANTFMIHKYCPFALVCAGGISIAKMQLMKFFLFGMVSGLVVLVSVVFVGRLFCNMICPLGLIQDISGSLPIPKWKLPKFLYFVKYLFLAAIIAGTVITGGFYFSGFCPAFITANTGKVPFNAAAIGLLVILALSFVFSRVWCKVFCPFSALMIIVQRIFGGVCSRNVKVNAKMHKFICRDNCASCGKGCLKWEKY